MRQGSGVRGRIFSFECETSSKGSWFECLAASGSILRKAMGPFRGGRANGRKVVGMFHPLPVLAGLLGFLPAARGVELRPLLSIPSLLWAFKTFENGEPK